MLAHRRVACTASIGSGSAQFEDAPDKIDEDLEDWEDTSEIIDSGEEPEEVELANDERRLGVGFVVAPSNLHL